ncbi:MAG: hypothetical protein AAB974_04505 [Patescibacteria group bacterium]
MAKQQRPPRKGRTFEKHPDDPGREPYRIVNLYDLRDRMIIAHGSEKPVHEGHLLFRATFFRPGKDSPVGDPGIGRSYWGHSAKGALGYCLRVCRGYEDWPANQYLALPYAEWLELVRTRVLPDDALPDLPETRRAAKPAQEPQKPVDPLAPTDPAPPKPNPTPHSHGHRVAKSQLALAF